MSPWLQPEPHNWWQIVEDALFEDIGSGDVSGGVIPPDQTVRWYIEAQQEGVLCGAGIAEYLLNPTSSEPDESGITVERVDGERLTRGTVVCSGVLSARRALLAERTILNFLMMLSGVATLTGEFVSKVEGTGARIVDTRKTVPLLR
ncbi:MAG TPA: hypothetical protein VG944_12485, partial [Fimbriimonas sp.]|nr:hypothetical protein [Fimbriimonas sp.]